MNIITRRLLARTAKWPVLPAVAYADFATVLHCLVLLRRSDLGLMEYISYADSSVYRSNTNSRNRTRPA